MSAANGQGRASVSGKGREGPQRPSAPPAGDTGSPQRRRPPPVGTASTVPARSPTHSLKPGALLRQKTSVLMALENELKAVTSRREPSAPQEQPASAAVPAKPLASALQPAAAGVAGAAAAAAAAAPQPSAAPPPAAAEMPSGVYAADHFSSEPMSPLGDLKLDAPVSVLVHAVSHSDVVLALRSKSGVELQARPKFNSFDPVCSALDVALREREAHGGLSVVKYASDRDPSSADFPVGYRMGEAVKFEFWDWFRLKTRRLSELPADWPPLVTGVYFPLLAVLLPRWLEVCDANSLGGYREVCLLSGSGTPWNKEHESGHNSTFSCAKMMENFIQECWPQLNVVIIHAGPAITRYDENIRFVDSQLRPKLEKLRRRVAERHEENWIKFLHVTLSLSGAAPAHVAAVSASLRQFQPDSLHLWQLTRFWHEFPSTNMVNFGELEYHTFEDLETRPAVPREHADAAVQRLVNEMIDYKRRFEDVLARAEDAAAAGRPVENELKSFWMRKSRKLVLAVLMVQRPGEEPKFYRGVNSEVSMPTGSLCCERNAIATALAANPDLKRRDLKMIAVVSLPIERGAAHLNPMEHCGVCMEWARKIGAANPDYKLVTFTDPSCARVYVKSVWG